jgi:hypothetical protein
MFINWRQIYERLFFPQKKSAKKNRLLIKILNFPSKAKKSRKSDGEKVKREGGRGHGAHRHGTQRHCEARSSLNTRRKVKGERRKAKGEG